MRIDRLDLIAFGPFTGAVLDLSGGAEGLHLVYGPNEAGKSSALRAIQQLFCGIPHRSTDNFVHKHADMRIGAVLRDRAGAALEVVRRKGTKNTLLGADGKPIDDPDARLARLLGGVAPEEFLKKFVIDHAELVGGGKAVDRRGGRPRPRPLRRRVGARRPGRGAEEARRRGRGPLQARRVEAPDQPQARRAGSRPQDDQGRHPPQHRVARARRGPPRGPRPQGRPGARPRRRPSASATACKTARRGARPDRPPRGRPRRARATWPTPRGSPPASPTAAATPSRGSAPASGSRPRPRPRSAS